jgi:hypothetical protein
MTKYYGTWRHGLLCIGQYPCEGLSTPCSRQLQHGSLFPAEDHCNTRGSELMQAKATYIYASSKPKTCSVIRVHIFFTVYILWCNAVYHACEPESQYQDKGEFRLRTICRKSSFNVNYTCMLWKPDIEINQVKQPPHIIQLRYYIIMRAVYFKRLGLWLATVYHCQCNVWRHGIAARGLV